MTLALRAGPLRELLAWLTGQAERDTPVTVPPSGMGEVSRLSVANGRTHVMVVDDDADARSMVVDILHSHGYAVTEAGDGVHALSMLNSMRIMGHPVPNLLLLDLVMPPGDETIRGANGEAVKVPAGIYFHAKILRKNELWTTIPVVLVSAPEMLEMYPQFRGLAKPFTPGRLLETVRRYASG